MAQMTTDVPEKQGSRDIQTHERKCHYCCASQQR
jgi:hypothetical protein